MTDREYDVIVTGGSSDVGELCIRRLVAGHRRVAALVRRPEAAQRVREAGADPVDGDFETGVFPDLRAPRVLHAAGVKFVDRLLPALDRWAPSLVVCVSSASATVPAHPLAERITAWENVLRREVDQAVIVRPTMIFGGPHDNNIRLLRRVTARMPVVPVPVRGEFIQPVFVDDLAALLVECVENNVVQAEPVVYGGPSQLLLEDVLRDLAAAQRKRSLALPISVDVLASVVERSSMAGRSRYAHAVTMLTERRVAPDPDTLGFAHRSTPWRDALTVAVDRYTRGRW